MSYNSKYTGQQVEDLLDQVNNGMGGSTPDLSGYATKEELNGKVDKVEGKQLSTEDFTTLLKQKLEGLSNYDDTEIQEAVSKLRTDLDTLVSGDTTTAIKTFNEIIAFLDGISDTEDLASIIASIEQQIAAKQGKILVINKGSNETTESINPNTFYKWGIVSSLSITMNVPSDGQAYNEYMFQFTSSSTPTTLSISESVKWQTEPNIEANKTYQVSIVDNIGLIIGV